MKPSIRLALTALSAALAMPLTASAAKADHKKDKNESAAKTFATLDKNSDGFVTEEEYLAIMKASLGETAAKTRFAELDKDHDGKLSKEEYSANGGEQKKHRKKKNAN